MQTLGDVSAKQAPPILQAAGLTANDVREESAYSLAVSIGILDAEVGIVCRGRICGPKLSVINPCFFPE